MPTTTPTLPALDTLKDVTRLVQTAEGFHPIVAALKNGRGAVVDGTWGSSSALVAAALGLHAPRTLLVVIGHPRAGAGEVVAMNLADGSERALAVCEILEHPEQVLRGGSHA